MLARFVFSCNLDLAPNSSFAAGAPAPFLVLAGRLCEANLFRGAHAAWFAGPRVLADGGLALVTPVDPLLLALPLLEAARRQVSVR